MNTPSRFFQTVCTVFVVFACVTLFSSMATAADTMNPGNKNAAAKEIKTASEHAGYAAKGKNVEAVHTHLHHVLNCLIGSDATGAEAELYDADAGNPCKGQGSGALHDYTGSGHLQDMLKQARALAALGLKVDELKPAQGIAKATQQLLEAVPTHEGSKAAPYGG